MHCTHVIKALCSLQRIDSSTEPAEIVETAYNGLSKQRKYVFLLTHEATSHFSRIKFQPSD